MRRSQAIGWVAVLGACSTGVDLGPGSGSSGSARAATSSGGRHSGIGGQGAAAGGSGGTTSGSGAQGSGASSGGTGASASGETGAGATSGSAASGSTGGPAGGSGSSGGSTGAAPCGNPDYATPPIDPGYRVIVESNAGESVAFPSASTSWELTYSFTVPPFPCDDTWNYLNQTFYLWGDVDFDQYGSSGSYPLSGYVHNQIAPEIMLGYALSGRDDAGFTPSWTAYQSWVMQAQYYWDDGDGGVYAQTGPVVPIVPDEEISSKISYDATTGAITASINDPLNSVSSITIVRPFPNRNPPPFSSWTDFFTQAGRLSGSLVGTPVASVDTHYVDDATACLILPFELDGMSIPGADTGADFQVGSAGGLSCGSLATLGF